MNKLSINKGAAMVELALLLPLLLVFVFGIAEMGRAIYQQSILTRAADSAIRMLSRSHLTIDTENECTPITGWDEAQADATNLLVYGDVDGGTEPLLEGLAITSIDIETRSLEDFDKDICIIVLNAEAPFTPVVSDALFGFPTFNLTVTAEQRYIGE